MEYLSEKVLLALEFASLAHKEQLRKYPVDIPYISHCFAVALILCKAGYDEDVVIAGALHDVVEDTKFTFEDIKTKFGIKVANLVMDVTEDKSIKEWELRKQKYLEHLSNASEEAMAISAADLLANRTDILIQLKISKEVWTKFEDPKKVIEFTEKRINILKTKLPKKLIEALETVTNQIKLL